MGLDHTASHAMARNRPEKNSASFTGSTARLPDGFLDGITDPDHHSGIPDHRRAAREESPRDFRSRGLLGCS